MSATQMPTSYALPGPAWLVLVVRTLQLVAGLVAVGVALAMMTRAQLGVMPWLVLDEGLAHQFGLSVGAVVIGTGLFCLALWIPLNVRPGIGTVCNALLIGVALEATLRLWPPGHYSPPFRFALMVTAIAVFAAGTAAYLATALGPGPRDGLMTGFARLTGRSLRLVRTMLEVGAVSIGWFLGGTVGLCTVLFAATIGPLIQHMLPSFTHERVAAGPAADAEAG